MKNAILKLLDVIDPPPGPVNRVPCPDCGNDLSKHCLKCGGGKDDLTYYLCKCGHASAWLWHGDDYAELIYGQKPGSYDFDE